MASDGWKVSGSDQAVWEPALSLLNNAGIKWYEGYDCGRIDDQDLVIVGSGPLMADPENPEFLKAKELGLKAISFPELAGEILVNEENIVVTGTYGKSTTSSMVAWLLEYAKKSPSYLIGGKPVNFERGVHRNKDSKYSVLEGDEFVTLYGHDMSPKFVHYKPKHTVISAAMWDHTDVYKTEGDYIDAFINLVELTNKNGGTVYTTPAGKNIDKVVSKADRLVTYAVEERLQASDTVNYLATNVEIQDGSSRFSVTHNDNNLGEFEMNMIGKHNVENALAAITVLSELGIDTDTLKEGLATYGGIKRRQEKRGVSKKGAIVIDDFAHSAEKARSTIHAIREAYPDHKIVALYSPRISSLQNRKEIDFYKGAFMGVDHVVLPKILAPKSAEEIITARDLIDVIEEHSKVEVKYMTKDEKIKAHVTDIDSEDTLFLFMSGSSWDHIISELVQDA